jgi:addiction module HigA family antidote
MKTKKMPPIHPGEVLLDDFMAPGNLTANKLALELRVPANRISDVIRGERGITADTALRLAAYFETSPELWMGLQSQYDLAIVEDASGEQIRREVHART